MISQSVCGRGLRRVGLPRFVGASLLALGLGAGSVASAQTTLTFTGTAGENLGTTVLHDGDAGSTALPFVDLNISTSLGQNWTYEFPYTSWGVVTQGYSNNDPITSITIESSDQTKNFAFQGIRVVDSGGVTSLSITGYDDGASTGTYTFDATNNYTNWETQLTTTELTDAIFGDLDKVVFTSTSGAFYVGINNIVVGQPSVPAPTVAAAQIAISSTGSGTGGTYKIGDTITTQWNNTGSGDNNAGITQVTMDFSQFGGGAAVTATNIGDTWSASYVITAGAIDATSRNVSVTASNLAAATTTADDGNLTVDNVAPTVTDANISISGASGTGGAYRIGDTVTATWNNTAGGDNNSDTISAATVDLSQFGGGAAVTATNSAGTWTATFTLTAGAIDTSSRNVAFTVTDNAGNSTTRADTTNATVDNVAPTVTDANISISGASGTGGAYRIGDTVTATWNNTAGGDNNSDTIFAATVDFSQFGGGSAVTATNSAGTWTATYTIISGSIDATNRNISVTVIDNAGNSVTAADTSNATVDTIADRVNGVTTTTADGFYGAGDTISILVEFADAAFVTGTPQLLLNSGGTANYTAGSGTATLSFIYTVQQGESAADLDYVSTTSLSGTITDDVGNALTLTLATPGAANSLGANAAIVIDGVNASVVSVAAPADGKYLIGQILDFTVNSSEALVVDTGGGTPYLSLTIGATPAQAAYLSGSGSTALVFRYTVLAGALDNNGIAVGLLALNGGRITDAAGNSLTTTLNSVGSTAAVLIDGRETQTIAFDDPGAQNFGTTPTLSATTTSALTVSFLSSTTGICTITSGGALSFVTAGTCTITADQSGDGSYMAATTVSRSFSVNAVAPGAPAINTATAGDAQATVTFTAPVNTGGSTITAYTVTANPGGLTGTGASSPITVSGLTNGVAYTFTVVATTTAGTGAPSEVSNAATPTSAQTITFADPGAQNFGTTPTLTATADSGLTVSLTSSTTGVCTITSGGILTFVSAGTCTINADQPGNSAYAAAAQVTQSFTVNAVMPGAPLIGSATTGDTQALVSFSAPTSTGGSAITGYTVTANPGGMTASGASSPITVTGLTNGISYTFSVTAQNVGGTGEPSAASNAVTPVAEQTITFTDPGTQTFGTTPVLSATATSGLMVSFSTDTPAICTVTTGGALTFISAGDCTINADQAGDATHLPSPQVRHTFAVTAVLSSAPAIDRVTAADGQARVYFTAPAQMGGAPATGYQYSLDDGATWNATSSAASPLTVPGLQDGRSYSVTLRVLTVAGAGASSAPVTFSTATVQTAFDAAKTEIRDIVQNEAARGLQSTLGANQRMMRDARDRFRSAQAAAGDCADPANDTDAAACGGSARRNQPLSFDGSLDANIATISTKGSFVRSADLGSGAQRLVFGDFDIQRDADTGSFTATANARLAWERMVSDRTLLGWFLGAEVAHASIAEGFDGDIDRLGLSVGTYVMHELADQVFVDGFVTAGLGQNILSIADPVLAIGGDYLTGSVMVGGSLTAVIEGRGYELWPELSFSYGRTHIGDIGLTGRAFGLSETGLILDAGDVDLASFLFRPEVRVPLDGRDASQSQNLVSFAPRLICERIVSATTQTNCGAGAELGYSWHSPDGMGSVSAKVTADRLGDRTGTALQLDMAQRF